MASSFVVHVNYKLLVNYIIKLLVIFSCETKAQMTNFTISCNETQVAVPISAKQTHYYEFNTKHSMMTVFIDLCVNYWDSYIDIYLYDKHLTELNSIGGHSNCLDSQLQLTTPDVTNGSYIISIDTNAWYPDSSSRDAIRYYLSLTCIPTPTYYYYPKINCNDNITAQTISPYQIDYYTFIVNQNMDTIIINLCASLFDTYLHLYDKYHNELYSNDDYATCLNHQSKLIIPLINKGTYIIGIGGFHNNYGTYNMDILCVPTIKPKTLNPTISPTTQKPSKQPLAFGQTHNPTNFPTNPTNSPTAHYPTMFGKPNKPLADTCVRNGQTIDLIILNDISSDLGDNNICNIFISDEIIISESNQLKRIGPNKLRIGETMELCMRLKLNSFQSNTSVIRVGKQQGEYYPGISLRSSGDNDDKYGILFKVSELNGTNNTIIVKQYEWVDIIPKSNIGTDIFATLCVKLTSHKLEAKYNESTIVFDINPHKIDYTPYYQENDENTFKLPVYAGDMDPINTIGALPPADGILKQVCIKTSGTSLLYDETASQCYLKQQIIAKSVEQFVPTVNAGTKTITNVRFAYIEYDCKGAYLVKRLDRNFYRENVSDLYERDCGDGTEDICGETTDLCSALTMAFSVFDNNNTNIITSILIISNNRNDQSKCDICNFQDKMHRNMTDSLMFNIDLSDPQQTNDKYELCLVEYDNHIKEIDSDSLQYLANRDSLQDYVLSYLCQQHIPGPTRKPTRKPTSNPTIYPTIYPTLEPTIYPTYNPTTFPTSDPTSDPTTFPSQYPTYSPSLAPTFNPTDYDQYNDRYGAHFELICALSGLNNVNLQKLVSNVVDVSHHISIIIEASFARCIQDLNSKNLWIKMESIANERMDQLRKYNKEYLMEIFDNKNEIKFDMVIECTVSYCDHIDEYYEEKQKLIVNITQNELEKYFNDQISNVNTETHHKLQFDILSMKYIYNEPNSNKTLWDTYGFMFIITLIIFLFCFVFVIYKYFNKEKPIFCNNTLVAIIGIEFYNPSDEANIEIDGYLNDLYAVSHDVKNLKHLFECLNYRVMTNNDNTEWSAQEIENFLFDVVTELIDDKNTYDGLVVVVSSHGLRDHIISSNYEKVDKTVIHRIISHYRSDHKHKQIRDIPRVFIYDCCSGANMRQRTYTETHMSINKDGTVAKDIIDQNKGIEYKENENEWTTNDTNPDYNVLRVDAANTGFQAFSNSITGSYLITSFVNKMIETMENNNYKMNKPLINIFEEIQDELHENGKQLIQINSYGTMIKRIRFKRNEPTDQLAIEYSLKKKKSGHLELANMDDDDYDPYIELDHLDPLKSTQL